MNENEKIWTKKFTALIISFIAIIGLLIYLGSQEEHKTKIYSGRISEIEYIGSDEYVITFENRQRTAPIWTNYSEDKFNELLSEGINIRITLYEYEPTNSIESVWAIRSIRKNGKEIW